MGLRQGHVLSPFFFILMMVLISRRTKPVERQRKRMYADDLALSAGSKEELVNVVSRWVNNPPKSVAEDHGLKVNT